jgi:hypothetical protein
MIVERQAAAVGFVRIEVACGLPLNEVLDSTEQR